MKNIMIVLDRDDFTKLIQGKEVIQHIDNNITNINGKVIHEGRISIKIILSDISFNKIKQIIKEEEQKHFPGATTIVKKSPTNIHEFITDFAKKVIKNTESKSAVVPESRQVNALCEETAKELFRLNEKIKNITKAVSRSIELHF